MTKPETDDRKVLWKDMNMLTDWEFAEVGRLLCDNTPHDLAAMVVRLQGEIESLLELVESNQ